MTIENKIVGEHAAKCKPVRSKQVEAHEPSGLKKTKNDKSVQPFFKRKEAYVLSALIATIAFVLEYHVLFSELSGGSSGKLLVAIPAVALILINSILIHSE